MARRNNGIREPEQRLWLYIVCSLTTMTGLLLWGVGSADHIHWFGVLFGAFLMGFNGVLAGATPIAYISDSYPVVCDMIVPCYTMDVLTGLPTSLSERV
jgi:hypothetical protein